MAEFLCVLFSSAPWHSSFLQKHIPIHAVYHPKWRKSTYAKQKETARHKIYTCVSQTFLSHMGQCLCYRRKICYRLQEQLGERTVRCMNLILLLSWHLCLLCSVRIRTVCSTKKRGGWHASACLMDNRLNGVEDAMPRERRRSECLFSEEPTCTGKRRRNKKFWVGRRINEQG